MTLRCLPFVLAVALAPLSAQSPDEIARIVGRAHELFAPVGLAVAVIDDGEVVYEGGFGRCDAGAETPVTAHSLFNIASCSKAFTAAAVGLLVERGKLAWDDPVVEHVPEFRLRDPWITRAMTVRDLLCHRSGLRTFMGDLLWYGSSRDDAAILARAATLPIERRFREEFGYQNVMYMVAGMVIERVDGRKWADFVTEEIMAPLGMTGSGANYERVPAGSQIAWPHVAGERIDVVAMPTVQPAGAIWSSAHDLSLWVRSLLATERGGDGALVGRRTLAVCWRPHTVLGGGSNPGSVDAFRSYGLGWFLSVQDGKKMVWHGGGMPGYISLVLLVPEEGFGLIALNNGLDGAVDNAVRDALFAARRGDDGFAVLEVAAKRAAAGKAMEQAEIDRRVAQRVANTAPSLPLTAYAGNYVDERVGEAEVSVVGEELRLVISESAATLHGTLGHWHHDTFRVDFPDRFLPFALVTFELDSTASVVGFQIDCPIPDFHFGDLRFRKQ